MISSHQEKDLGYGSVGGLPGRESKRAIATRQCFKLQEESGRGWEVGEIGGDDYVYRAVAALTEAAHRLSVRCWKAVGRTMPPGV